MPLFKKIIPSINLKSGKLYETDENFDAEYNPYMVNYAFSVYPDTIFYADEMNEYWELSKKAQYNFYYTSVPNAKRFSKWPSTKKQQDLQIIKEYFKYSEIKAKQALKILTEDQIKEIKIKLGVDE